MSLPPGIPSEICLCLSVSIFRMTCLNESSAALRRRIFFFLKRHIVQLKTRAYSTYIVHLKTSQRRDRGVYRKREGQVRGNLPISRLWEVIVVLLRKKHCPFKDWSTCCPFKKNLLSTYKKCVVHLMKMCCSFQENMLCI